MNKAMYTLLRAIYFLSVSIVVLLWMVIHLFAPTWETLVESASNQKYTVDVYSSARGATTEDGFRAYVNDENDFWPFPVWAYSNDLAGDSVVVEFIGQDTAWIDFFSEGNHLRSKTVKIDLAQRREVRLHPHDLLRRYGKQSPTDNE